MLVYLNFGIVLDPWERGVQPKIESASAFSKIFSLQVYISIFY